MVALAVVGLVLGFAGVGLVIATGSGYVRPPDLSLADADAAYGACQGFVRTQLKAAGPVTFAPLRRRTVRRYADGRVLVRSHADVTSAAGHLVEIRITCTMRPLGGDRWDLEGLALRSD
jgi:hypothetical protein